MKKTVLFSMVFSILISACNNKENVAEPSSEIYSSYEDAIIITNETEPIEILSEADAIHSLLIFIFPEGGDEYFGSSTIKYLKFPELAAGDPMLTYEFLLPDDNKNKRVKRIASRGLLEDKSYYILDYYISYYSYDDEDETKKVFSHSTYAGAYAVNSMTGEVIREREMGEDGLWIYNENFPH